MISKKTTLIFLGAAAVLLALIGLLVGPIPQPESYHDFADQRSWLGIPNAWNVLSNIPFALAGIGGLFLLYSPEKGEFIDDRERWPWIGVSMGLILTAMGSAYYHLAPDNSRLVWDRLPMTIIFMSYVAALISERVNIRLGLWLWPALLAIGFYSVVQWQASELRGASDLRFYLGVQGFTILATLVMLAAPSPYDRSWALAIAALLFGLARLCEIFDHQIWMFTEGVISGHTLKHLTAALAGMGLIGMIAWRKIVSGKRA